MLETVIDILQWPIGLAMPFLGGWFGKYLRDVLWDAHEYRGTWKPR